MSNSNTNFPNSQEELQKKANGKVVVVVVSIIALFMLITGVVGYYFLASIQAQNKNITVAEQTSETTNRHRYFEETSVSEVAELIKSKDIAVIIGKKSCSHCQTYKPKAKKFATEKKLQMYYVDLDSETNQSDILRHPSLSVVGTPTTFFFHNGEKVEELVGDATIERIEEALRKAKDSGFKIE